MKMLVAMLAIGALTLGPAIAIAASQTSRGPGRNPMLENRAAQGEIAAADPIARSMQVSTTHCGARGPLLVEITDQTMMHNGSRTRRWPISR